MKLYNNFKKYYIIKEFLAMNSKEINNTNQLNNLFDKN